jgi:hypothetical protein
MDPVAVRHLTSHVPQAGSARGTVPLLRPRHLQTGAEGGLWNSTIRETRTAERPSALVVPRYCVAAVSHAKMKQMGTLAAHNHDGDCRE